MCLASLHVTPGPAMIDTQPAPAQQLDDEVEGAASKTQSKRWCMPSFRPSEKHNKEAHSRNEGTPSFQRKHNMFRICSHHVLKNAKEENQLL